MDFVNRMCAFIPTRKAKRLTKKYASRLLGIKDYSLYSGERQTAADLDQIRKDHTARYRLAADFLEKHYGQAAALEGYDVFCGIGYGTFMLSEGLKNAKITGIDGSTEAIELANRCYRTPGTTYRQEFFPFELPENSADFFVSLESLEHVQAEESFLGLIERTLKPRGILIISVPNEEKWKLDVNAQHFHFRHYKPAELTEKLKGFGFELIRRYGQDIYKMSPSLKKEGQEDSSVMEDLKPDYDGQCCIYICRKTE
jgi:2-polyprenyl-3-methyl-5-hydroxy-6-metoxy-1,4-benzoquinol methylase